MDDRDNDASERERRLDELATAYLKAQEAGETPDRQALLDSNPELAVELGEFFADQDRLERLAAPLRSLADPSGPDASSTPFPTHTGTQTAPLVPPPPRSFGDYTVLSAVGQGGMGVVWKARQKRPDRVVALKMFRAGDLAAPTDVQRFRNEAEVIAQLDHPHILPVYEVGEHDGVHYFSMKLVEGGSLADHLASFRADPRAAARLLATIARAVHYAHQRGILHRDLKPSNILLDAQGQPHVSDFGLAKRVEIDSSLTQSGALVGTPSYMAPEQTHGRKGAVTTATDVYGLGAVLYALLTGRPPFRGETVLETMEQVREREPEPPRRINAKVDRDLETICLKCLQKEPQRRYESAQALAEDLERWLAGEPIQARRASSWERFGKWIRRRPAMAGLVAVSTLAVLGLVIGLLWHNAQLGKSAEREQQLAGKAARQRDEARRAVNDMYTEVAEKWLSGEPRMSNVQRAFLEKALRYYEELAQEEEEGPEQLLERAKAHRRSGTILAKLEQRTEAEAAYRRAIALLESADVPGKTAELAEDYTALGVFLAGMQRNAEAETAYQRAKTLWESIPSDEAAQPEVRYGWASTLNNLAALLMFVNRDADCKSFVEQGLPLIRGVVVEFPQEARYQAMLGAMLNHYAIATSRLGDPARACEYMNEAIAHQAKAVKLDPRQPRNRLFLRNHYAVLAVHGLLPLKRYSEAADAARKALDVAERLAADFPAVPHYQRVLADAYWDLGDVLKRSDHALEAEQAISQAGKIEERVVAADPNSPSDRMLAGAIYSELGDLRRNIGRYGDAVRAYRKTLEFAPKDFSANNNLVWLLALGAEPGFNDPAELVRLARTATEANPEKEYCWVTLGLAHYRSGDWTAAKAALQKPSKLSPATEGMRNVVLAMTEWRLGNKTAARTAYDRAVKLLGQPKPEPGAIDDRRLHAEAARLLGITDPATKP